jgi:uncharacterized membrane protein YqgA involved in biofilm formation
VRGIGTAVNVTTVLFGTTAGLLLRRSLPRRVLDEVPRALGIFTIVLGIRQSLQSSNVLMLLGGLASGVAIGSWLGLDKKLDALVSRTEQRVVDSGSDSTHQRADRLKAPASGLADAAVLPSLVFCVGPMTLLGALQDGARGEPELLIVKAVMDGFAAIAFAAALGAGVYLSAVTVLVFQGALTLLAGILAPLLSDQLIAETTAVGGVLVLAIGIELLGIRELPIVDYLPALVTTPLIVLVVSMVT